MAEYEVIIIGSGAAGLVCAIAAGRRGRRLLVLDHASEVGAKILPQVSTTAPHEPTKLVPHVETGS